jgi:hypothetical protein
MHPNPCPRLQQQRRPRRNQQAATLMVSRHNMATPRLGVPNMRAEMVCPSRKEPKKGQPTTPKRLPLEQTGDAANTKRAPGATFVVRRCDYPTLSQRRADLTLSNLQWFFQGTTPRAWRSPSSRCPGPGARHASLLLTWKPRRDSLEPGCDAWTKQTKTVMWSSHWHHRRRRDLAQRPHSHVSCCPAVLFLRFPLCAFRLW